MNRRVAFGLQTVAVAIVLALSAAGADKDEPPARKPDMTDLMERLNAIKEQYKQKASRPKEPEQRGGDVSLLGKVHRETRPGIRRGGPVGLSHVALAPTEEAKAVTGVSRPTLYWYVLSPLHLPVSLTISEQGRSEPVVDHELPIPSNPGFQQIDLARYGVRLSPGVEYRWYVSVMPDKKSRSKDIVAGATIRFVDGAAKEAWYDELHRAYRQYQADPADEAASRALAQLLMEAGWPFAQAETTYRAEAGGAADRPSQATQ